MLSFLQADARDEDEEAMCGFRTRGRLGLPACEPAGESVFFSRLHPDIAPPPAAHPDCLLSVCVKPLEQAWWLLAKWL